MNARSSKPSLLTVGGQLLCSLFTRSQEFCYGLENLEYRTSIETRFVE